MKKKLFASMVSVCMAATLLAGCSGGSKTEATKAAETKAPETVAEAAASEAAEATDGAVTQPAGYPSKSAINWIVPSSAGGSLDGFTRAIADQVKLGGNIAVENISGGSYTIGMAQAAAADPDGTTLCTVATTGMITMPLTSPDLTYNQESFRYICKIAPDGYSVMTTNKNNEITADEIWNKLKNGDEITIGTSSVGGHAYVEMAQVLLELGTFDKVKFVTYNGSNSILQAIENGEVEYGLLDNTYVASYHDSGEVNAVLVLSPTKDDLLPEVACVGDYQDIQYLGDLIGVKLLAVSSDTPEDIVQWIKQQVDEVVLSDEYQAYLETSNSGTLDRIYTEAELNEWLANATAGWDRVLTDCGLK